MFRKSFVIILAAIAAAAAFGQTPEAGKDKAPRAMAWTIEGDGGGYLGVQTQEVTKDNFSKFGLAAVRGVAIEKVVENSPASAAGLQAGDVILRVDGEEVTGARKLTRLIGEVAPDHQIKLTIARSGGEQEITATVGKRPMPKFENGNFEFNMPMGKIEMPDMKDLPQLKDIPELKDMPKDGTPRVFAFPGGEGKAFAWTVGGGRQIGVGITPLTKQLAEHFGVDSGVMISEVRDGSPAFKAGLKAGDIIVEADGNAVRGDLDLVRTINGKKDGDVTLQIVRDGKRQTISVTPEASKDGGFLFRNGDESGFAPAPGRVRITPPAMPAMPAMPTAAPLTVVRPGRVI